ncbi:hypothetical protein KIL84_007153 [Mauremys mutica]|uniref:Uncharacterized protein n=1 Tax=Mauremys mutica TaxID=74926 RepID=A0A9D3X2J6_9SAUR|nr:hypothetical protein KIL84_007153 [Mauremys mutica]
MLNFSRCRHAGASIKKALFNGFSYPSLLALQIYKPTVGQQSLPLEGSLLKVRIQMEKRSISAHGLCYLSSSQTGSGLQSRSQPHVNGITKTGSDSLGPRAKAKGLQVTGPLPGAEALWPPSALGLRKTRVPATGVPYKCLLSAGGCGAMRFENPCVISFQCCSCLGFLTRS